MHYYGAILGAPGPDLAQTRMGRVIEEHLRTGVDGFAHRLTGDLEPERRLLANGPPQQPRFRLRLHD